MKKLIFNGEKCTGCSICAIACMDQHDYDPARDGEPFRRAGEREHDGKFTFYSVSCVHCGVCIDACPLDCISRDAETGFVICDNSACVGCRSCYNACPLNVPSFGTDGKMHKCDGCNTRVKAGLEPACVRACPRDALQLKDT